MIQLAREDAVAVLTIDRPEAMNALDVGTLEELRDRLVELRGDEGVGAIVLTGAGDRAFAAGADIKYMSGLSVDEAKEWGGLGHEVGQLLETAPKATIAAVNGFALGGGCELALACDIRYASDDGQARPARGQPRHHPRLGRHAAARAGLRARRREGARSSPGASSTPTRRCGSASSTASSSRASCWRRRSRSRS